MRALTLLAVAALVALPGCGSEDKGRPIPSDQASRIISLVRQADAANQQGGHCKGAQAKVAEAQTVVEQLPRRVGKDVRQGLSDSLAHLNDLIRQESCAAQTTQTETTPSETTTSETTTSQTETTPTETTPTETTPTETTPTETTTTDTGTTTTTTTTTTTGNGGTGPGTAPSGEAGQ